jgi:hypothetical protein
VKLYKRWGLKRITLTLALPQGEGAVLCMWCLKSAQAFVSLSHRERVGERGLKQVISPLILSFSRREKGPKSMQ